MGRNKKIGLNYFPFDVDFFSDIKIRKLIKYQGGKAVAVYALLLCNIYEQGYYMRWDNELPFIISEQTGFEEAYIQEVIKCCLVVGLFSKELYEKEKVFTSKGIQERYQKICVDCRRKCEFSEFSLISSEETRISSEEKPINSAKSTQSKSKKREYSPSIPLQSGGDDEDKTSLVGLKKELDEIGLCKSDWEYVSSIQHISAQDSPIWRFIDDVKCSNFKYSVMNYVVPKLKHLVQLGELSIIIREPSIDELIPKLSTLGISKKEIDTITDLSVGMYDVLNAAIKECLKGGIKMPGRFITSKLK